MSFQVYVGNYPGELTKQDVQNLFRDFNGMRLIKFFKKDPKCYSFFVCKDIEQVVSAIQEKNNSLVCGRTLKVRAVDDNLQSYVNLLLQEKSEKGSCSGGSSDSFQVIKNKSSFQKKKYNEIRDAPEKTRHNSYNQSYSDACGYDTPDTARYNEKVISSPTKSTTRYSYNSDYSVGAWVSVTNFPIGTHQADLIKLFCDYNPLEVKMICNYARKDRTLTEAHICFVNQEVANDVILNFDNTMFQGRLVLVNDIDDLTIMNELLDVTHS